METFVALRNSYTSSEHPQSAGNTNSIEIPDTTDFPTKCTRDIRKNAMPAGSEKIAQTSVMT